MGVRRDGWRARRIGPARGEAAAAGDHREGERAAFGERGDRRRQEEEDGDRVQHAGPTGRLRGTGRRDPHHQLDAGAAGLAEARHGGRGSEVTTVELPGGDVGLGHDRRHGIARGRHGHDGEDPGEGSQGEDPAGATPGRCRTPRESRHHAATVAVVRFARVSMICRLGVPAATASQAGAGTKRVRPRRRRCWTAPRATKSRTASSASGSSLRPAVVTSSNVS